MKGGILLRKDFEDFISVTNNVIFGKEIDISGIKLENVYLLARAHDMNKIFFEFVKKNYGKASKEYAEYSRKNDLLDYKYVCLCREYNALRRHMEEQGISYLPIKGIVTKEIYPHPELREMSDADIYTADVSAVREYLTGKGYDFGPKGHHDVYTKPPGICFEIHKTLIDKQRDTGFDKYFENPAELSTANGCEMRLTPENEFLYLTAHLYGHFHQGGTGVRSVLDLYLYKEKIPLDFEYANKIFAEIGIADFAENIMNVAEGWFSDGEKTPLTEELGDYIMTSGTYGKIDRATLDLSDENSSKLENIRYIVKRKLFLSGDEIKKRYPWAENGFLMPAAYAKRVFEVIAKNPEEMRIRAAELKKTNKKKLKEHKERMKRFGVKIN